jgi:L-alanine-DL-glutamate epimerase-like enolase superfamily enzyme
MTADWPAVAGIDASVYVIPADAHVGAATVNLRHVEYFHDHQRIEQLLFDGTLDPLDGVLSPEPGQPGLGLELRTSDAEKYRRL